MPSRMPATPRIARAHQLILTELPIDHSSYSRAKGGGRLAGLPERSALVGTRAHELFACRSPYVTSLGPMGPGPETWIDPARIDRPPTSESRPARATMHVQNAPAAGRYLLVLYGLFAASGRRGSTHLRRASAPIA